jgi:tRNA pseudouridine55 synthase
MIKNGYILVNKKVGMQSVAVTNKIKRILRTKVGHGGTLDKLAEGLMFVACGSYTKQIQAIIDTDKKYRFKIGFGEERSTGDLEGEIINTGPNIDVKTIDESIVKSFLGKQEQIPPLYSAIKIAGSRSSDLARQNKEVELKPRNIEIFDIHIDAEGYFIIHCSKGTYVRSLCVDIAKKLGTVGHASHIERTAIGKYCVSESVKIDDINDDNISSFIRA